MQNLTFNIALENYCKSVETSFATIPEERKVLLKKLGKYIAEKAQRQADIKLVVICTHNSRRSHIGQLWLQTAALWYGIPKVETFSGGTEATAFNRNAIEALQRVGFLIEQESKGENPVYRTNFMISEPVSMSLFSKTYDSPPNPKESFAAIMVCSEADAGCPFVLGADARFAIPFEDPKIYDNTAQQSKEYDKSVHHIGREFFFAVQYASKLLNHSQ